MAELVAIVLLVLVMAVIGYALTRLAEPASSLGNPSSNSDKVSKPDAQTRLPDTNDPGEIQPEKNVAKLIEEVNRRLPQTQCAQCGHPGCRPYAEAIINDNAPINQCPPGGEALIEELANFLDLPVVPLDDGRGETKPAQVAFIVEEQCIGCVLCIAACPVDAIVGAPKLMHTVIASHCTGCELCLAPCPVDCIELHPVPQPLHRWQWPKPS